MFVMKGLRSIDNVEHSEALCHVAYSLLSTMVSKNMDGATVPIDSIFDEMKLAQYPEDKLRYAHVFVSVSVLMERADSDGHETMVLPLFSVGKINEDAGTINVQANPTLAQIQNKPMHHSVSTPNPQRYRH